MYLAKWRETTVAVKLLHRQLPEHQDDDLPATICSSGDDPILAALQRVSAVLRPSTRNPKP